MSIMITPRIIRDKPMPVDEDVHALAKRFLDDLPFKVADEDVQLLAETLQDTCESFIQIMVKQEAEKP